MGVRIRSLVFNSERQEALVEFYSALGVNFEARPVKEGSVCYSGTLEGLEILIYGIKKANRSQNPNFSLRIDVDQIQVVLEKLKKVPHVEVIMDFEMLPEGKMAILLDPDGHSIELLEGWADQGLT